MSCSTSSLQRLSAAFTPGKRIPIDRMRIPAFTCPQRFEDWFDIFTDADWRTPQKVFAAQSMAVFVRSVEAFLISAKDAEAFQTNVSASPDRTLTDSEAKGVQQSYWGTNCLKTLSSLVRQVDTMMFSSETALSAALRVKGKLKGYFTRWYVAVMHQKLSSHKITQLLAVFHRIISNELYPWAQYMFREIWHASLPVIKSRLHTSAELSKSRIGDLHVLGRNIIDRIDSRISKDELFTFIDHNAALKQGRYAMFSEV